MMLTEQSEEHLKLLIVDPSDTEQGMMLSVLNERNCHVSTEKDLAGALDLARTFRPDVIIVDHSMKLDGVELCRQVRQDPDLANTPIVLMTSFSHSRRAIMVGIFESGCDQVLHKPFKPKELHAAIQSALFRGESDKLIPVLHNSGDLALVAQEDLEQLIAKREILCFRRRDEFAVIDRDRIRIGGHSDYRGLERRRLP